MLLRCSDLQAAHFAAVDRFRRADQPMDTISSMSEFSREKDLQEVWLMLLEENSRRPQDRVFKTADEARSELTIDEVAWFEAKHAELVRDELEKSGVIVKEEPDVGGRPDQDQ